MSFLVLEDVSLSFGGKRIVESLDLRIGDADRIGLIGPNGSGKSTLLKMFAGEQEPDGGAIQKQNGLRLGYLPQDIALEGGRTLIDFVRDSIPGYRSLHQAIETEEHTLTELSQTGSDSPELMQSATRIAELHEELSRLQDQYSEHEALAILDGLGFSQSDLNRDLAEFSGGWKMRAVLAALLFQKPDVLLLDEPTNHLDMPSVAWFSTFLQNYSGSFVLICHDREFLNEQIGRVVSFEVEGVRSYTGNFESYLLQRKEEEEILKNRAKNLGREREKTEDFIRRFRAKASKSNQVQSRIKALEKMDPIHLLEERSSIHMRFVPSQRSGVEVQRAEGLGHSFGSHTVFSGADLSVRRGDRIGIIGVNGAGKTTLLKILAGELQATEGKSELGHNVDLGYYAQHHTDQLHPKQSVYEEVASQNRDANMTQVRTLLGAFLFQGDDVDKKISVLSGGERARVALAKLLIDPRNYLMMDEPTNHLDLDSSEALAEALANYDGSIVFVSHNKSFVRKLATKIWNVEGGRVEVYPGNLDEYLQTCQDRHKNSQKNDKSGKKQGKKQPELSAAPKVTEKTQDRQPSRKSKASENQSRLLSKRIAELETRIEALEAKQKECNRVLEKPEVYNDPVQRNDLLTQLQVNAEKLSELTKRWEALQEELEALSPEI
ncbi:MAG: ATP-binding cassette domain-containing protein [Myxococcales bacterium]|nr:MAG: ATP-binding cassette domain-containing protein [Myxococcales bacterium]